MFIQKKLIFLCIIKLVLNKKNINKKKLNALSNIYKAFPDKAHLGFSQ